MTDKLRLVFDSQDRPWTWAAECWGNDEMQVRFDTLEQLSRRYGSLYDSMGAEVDVCVADGGAPAVEETCGDCVEGRCHWGGDDPLPGEECGCERHDASVKARRTIA